MEIEYAGTAMMEIAGILTTLIAIVAYLWHLRRATELTALATGIALAMAFFTKYNYGLFAIGAVAVCQLSLRQWQPWRRENLWLWVPFVALADLWFTVEGKWEGFLGFANNYDSGMPMLSSTSLLFYPRYFLAEDTSSVLLGGVTVLAGLCAVGWIKQPPVRAVFLFFAVTLGSLTVHHLKEDRYLATVVPVLYLLAGFTLVQVHSRINLPWIRRGVTASGLLLLIPALLLYVKGVPRLVSHNRPSWSSFPWSYRDLYQATDFVLAQIDPRVPTSVTGLINPWSPEYVKWRFESDRPGSKLYLDHLEKGRVNFVWMELLPGSAYRTAEYLQFHPDIEERRAKMAVRVTSGIRTEAVYPRDGLKVVVLRDAEVAR